MKMIEKQNFNSEREAVEIKAKTLTSAKREATRRQSSQRSIIEIVGDNGETLAVKEKNGKWIEEVYFA